MKIGIIGCGNMGGAIARGILSKKVLPFNNIYISDKDSQKTKSINRTYGARISTNEEIAKKCNFIIIAVKPQDARKVICAISDSLDKSKHVISVMAGVTIKKIESMIKNKKVALTRAMPNIAALTGKAITCLSHNKNVKEKTFANKIFSSVGDVMEIEERLKDAVTAVSGSGPAYFMYITECLREAAVKLGIKKEKASELAHMTLIGSGSLLENLDYLPEVLRQKITSKKGTTETAIKVFKDENIKKIIINAVKAAAKRANEISKG